MYKIITLRKIHGLIFPIDYGHPMKKIVLKNQIKIDAST